MREIVRTLHYFFNLWVMSQLSIWLQIFDSTSWPPIKSYFWWPPKTHFLNSSCCTVLLLNKNNMNLNPFNPRLWVMTEHSIWLPMLPMVPSFSKCLWFSWTPKTVSSTSSCRVWGEIVPWPSWGPSGSYDRNIHSFKAIEKIVG